MHRILEKRRDWEQGGAHATLFIVVANCFGPAPAAGRPPPTVRRRRCAAAMGLGVHPHRLRPGTAKVHPIRAGAGPAFTQQHVRGSRLSFAAPDRRSVMGSRLVPEGPRHGPRIVARGAFRRAQPSIYGRSWSYPKRQGSFPENAKNHRPHLRIFKAADDGFPQRRQKGTRNREKKPNTQLRTAILAKTMTDEGESGGPPPDYFTSIPASLDQGSWRGRARAEDQAARRDCSCDARRAPKTGVEPIGDASIETQVRRARHRVLRNPLARFPSPMGRRAGLTGRARRWDERGYPTGQRAARSRGRARSCTASICAAGSVPNAAGRCRAIRAAAP